MRAVSAAFTRSLSGSHTPIFRARVCETFQTGTSPVGAFIDVIDGLVTLDGKAAERGTLDLVTTAPWPVLADDLMAPYGNEIFVERGIRYSDALVEWVGLGYFRVETPAQNNASSRTSPVRLNAVDRMRAIIEGRLLTPIQFLSGTTFGVVVETLVLEIYPDAVIEWDDGTDVGTLTRSIIVEEDRYGFLNDAITSRGKIWYWDHRGVLVIKSVPSTTPVYTVNHGQNGVLVTTDRELTREDSFNAVVATGGGADELTPVRAVVADNDPDSPTFFFGRFGKVPRYYSSTFLTTNEQCAGAASSILMRELGLAHRFNFGSIVHPGLEPYDAVNVRFSHYEAAQAHVLDVVPIPLHSSGIMEAETREQRVALASIPE